MRCEHIYRTDAWRILKSGALAQRDDAHLANKPGVSARQRAAPQMLERIWIFRGSKPIAFGRAVPVW